jgi:hypothetical protein
MQEWTGVKYSSQRWIEMGTKTKRTQEGMTRQQSDVTKILIIQ